MIDTHSARRAYVWALVCTSFAILNPNMALGADVGPFCGGFSLYSALRLYGIQVDPATVINDDFVTGHDGSTVQDLHRAATLHGLKTASLRGLSVHVLADIRVPAILHVKKSVSSKTFDHWLLYLGQTADGRARVYDAPQPISEVSLSELNATWDGTAILLSTAEVAVTPLLIGQYVRISLFVIGWLGLVLAYHLLCRKGLLRNVQDSGSLLQLGAVILVVLVASVVHLLADPATSLTDPEALREVQAEHFEMFPVVTAEQVAAMRQHSRVVVVDARYGDDYSSGHIPGSINVPVGYDAYTIAGRFETIDADQPIIIYCQSDTCPFSKRIALILARLGQKNLSIYEGGWVDWVKRYPASVERTAGEQ